MKKVIRAVVAGALLAGGGSLIDVTPASAQGSASVGNLRGVIRDKATGAEAVGATVVATSPSLQGEQVVITEEGGQYYITSLPPGLYTLTVYYNDATFSRGNVLIQLGKEAVVNITVDSGSSSGRPRGEVIEIKGSAPIVDQGSTKVGVSLTDEYTRNVPVGRTFGAVIGSAAGAQSDNYGVSLSGATSAENTYIVEGINTTDTAYGGISSNLPNEFIQETEVIAGGYNAEFGRATGGIINVVTKQGSNEFRGSVFGYFQPGALIADAKRVNSDGGALAAETNLDYRADLGGELGGPIIKDKLWFHVGFNPSFASSTTDRIVNTQVDADGDGIPDVDANGFTVRDEVSRSEAGQDFKTYFFTAKINGAIDQNNQFQISAFGNPRNAEDITGLTRNPQQLKWKYDDGAYDFAGKWTSKLNEGKTQVDAVLGYHRGFSRERPFDSAQDVPYTYYRYDRSLYDFASLEGEQAIAQCQDGGPNDPYPDIVNCPVFGYASQGLSFIEDRTNARTSAAVSLTHRVKLAGYHVFKVGADLELAGYDAFNRYSGGAVYRRNGADSASGAPGSWQLREFFQRVRTLTPDEQMDPSSVVLEQGQSLCANDLAICARSEGVRADTNNRNIAAFIQDSWQVRPNLTFNVGLRWEQQIGYAAEALQGQVTPEGEIVPDAAYKLNNLVAPRIGFIFDPTREGKSKLFGHYGRFYENVPLDLNVRAFGGEIENYTAINATRQTPSSGSYDPNCNVDFDGTTTGAEIVSRLDMCGDRVQQAIIGGGTEYVSPGMRGQRTDEIIVGAEYEIAPDLKLGLNYLNRKLPVVIEDISVDGGNTYIITNPGFDFTSEAEKLAAQAAELMMSSDPQQRALGQVYQTRADSLAYVNKLEKPIRDYSALQVTATQRPTKASLLIASYTYSQSKGNYPGLFSTETGQLDPNLTSLYDLPSLMANRYGPMGLDRPHNLKVDGFYAFDLKKAGQLTVGGSARAQSGVAHNVLGAHPIYGTGESYILRRGVSERSPMTTQVDARLAYGYRVNKTTMVEAFVNVFNLFNSQEELNQDENYTFDFVNPIIGGDATDLRHLKTIDGVSGQEINSTPIKNKNFANTGGNNNLITNIQQAPRAMQLGFRVTF